MDAFSFTQTWVLAAYSKYNNPKINQNKGDWTTLDAENLLTPLTISITPNNFLQIKHELDIKEFINLSTCKHALNGLYKGDSLLITHKTKDYIRKFRVRFLASKTKSGQENCLNCVGELKKYFQVADFDSLNKPYINDTPTSKTPNQFMTQKEMVQTLLDKNEHKLPLFYQQMDDSELLGSENENAFDEFVVACLLDPKFPSFVKKIELVLNKCLMD